MKVLSNGEMPKAQWGRLMAFGPTGAGKTTLGATMPRPFVVVAVDDNAAVPLRRTLKEVPRVWVPEGETHRLPDYFLEVDNGWPGVKEAETWLHANVAGLGIKSVVFDSITAASEQLMRHTLRMTNEKRAGRGKPLESLDQRGYGTVYRCMDDLRYSLHDLPAHVLWLAGFKPPVTRTDGDVKELKRGGPDLPGQQVYRFPSNVQASVYVDRDGKTVRVRTAPFNDIDAKDNTGLLDSVEVPDVTVILARMGFLDPVLTAAIEETVPRRAPEIAAAEAELGLSFG